MVRLDARCVIRRMVLGCQRPPRADGTFSSVKILAMVSQLFPAALIARARAMMAGPWGKLGSS